MKSTTRRPRRYGKSEKRYVFSFYLWETFRYNRDSSLRTSRQKESRGKDEMNTKLLVQDWMRAEVLTVMVLAAERTSEGYEKILLWGIYLLTVLTLLFL
jgi:hypothetical protein